MSYQQQNVQAALVMKVNILASVVKQQLMKNLLEKKLKGPETWKKSILDYFYGQLLSSTVIV